MTTHPVAPRPSRVRATLTVSAAALLALVATLLTPLAAHAAVGLSGVVVGPTGAALASVSVKAIDADTGAEVASATSSATGAFSFTLSPDAYTLKFAQTSTTFAQYLGGTSVLANAQRIVLDGGNGDKSTIRASLSASGKIVGSVKTTSNAAVAAATVSVFVAKGAKWDLVRSVSTTSTGAYSISGLEPGDYRLQAKKGTTYAPVYSGGAASIQAASDVGVLPAGSSTVNFKVGTAAKVSGVVRVNTGSAIVPLAGVKVTAYRFVGSASPSAPVEQLAISAVSTSTGAFTLTGLPPGDYTLYFDAPASSDAGSTFLGGTSSPHEALSFVVGSGASVTGRNATLVEAGSISGSYHNSVGGAPIAGARVSVYANGQDPDDALTVPRAVVVTQGDGSFHVPNLGPGTYTLVFGAFERLTPTENIDFERRGWSPISLAAGEDSTGANQTSVERAPVAPAPGSEPQVSFSGFANGKVGGWAELSIGSWNSSGYGVVGGYRWYRDGVLIPGEGGFQYALRAGDVGHKISGEVYRTDWALGYGSYRTGETTPVQPGDAPTNLNGAPVIVGPAKVGRSLTVDPGEWEVNDYSGDTTGRDLGIVWTYTWQRSVNNSVYTDVETASSHTVTAADLTSGPYLRVHMHGERFGYADVEYTTLPVVVQNGQFVQVTAPKVSATTTTFSADAGTWSPAPTDVKYLWRVYDAANGVEQTKTTSTLPRAGLAGKRVTLSLTYTADGVDDTQITLPVQTGKAPTATGSLAVTGTPRVAEAVTAPVLTWSLVPDTVSYRWQFLSGTTWKTIAGATSSTFTPTATYLGRRLRVIETAVTSGYQASSKTSTQTATVAAGAAPVAGVAASFSTPPAANAVAIVDPGSTTPGATSVAYVWKSGPTAVGPWTTISGATSASYKVPASLILKWLQVTVTSKRTGHASLVQVLTSSVSAGLAVNTVKPTVTGPANGVYTLATPGTWAPTPASVDQQWYVRAPDGSESVMSSNASFDAATFAAHFPVDVVVTAHENAPWANGTIRIPVKNGDFQYNDPSSIQNSEARVGTTLHGTLPNLFNPPAGALKTIQWQYEKTPNVWVAIPGATSIDYTPTSTYLGKNVRLTVRSTADRYAASDSPSASLPVQAGLTPAPGSGADAPAFSGTAKIGQKLIFTPGTWSVPGLAFTYQWQSRPTSGDPWTSIAGATAAAYTPDAGRWGHDLQVKVTAKKAGFPNAVVELSAGVIGDGQLAAVTAPVVTKTGSTLKVSTGTWNTPGATFTYAWFRAYPDTQIEQIGTSATLTLTPADLGMKVYAEVYADKTHYAQGYATAVGQAGPKLEPTSTITISGTRAVGQTLTATDPSWNVGFAVPARQWLRNGVAIAGATGLTYTTTASDLGKTISLRTTATAGGYPSYTGTVSAGVIVAAAAPMSQTAPVASVVGGGSAQVGKKVSVTTGTWSVTGLTFAYQWYRGENPITGATASTYTLSAADLGFELSARVTASKAGLQSAPAVSQLLTVQTGAAPTAPVPAVSLVAGNMLKAGAVTWSLPSTVTYQWQVSSNNSTWADVTGATADTAPTSIVPAGWFVRVVLSAHRAGHADGTVASAGTQLP